MRKKMLRSMMQVFVRESDKAVMFYQQTFGAELISAYSNEDGTYMHAELDVFGQVLALSEASKEEEIAIGNTMMFCLHFGKGKEVLVTKIYDALKDGAQITSPLGPCSYSSLEASLVDKFGIWWCIFV